MAYGNQMLLYIVVEAATPRRGYLPVPGQQIPAGNCTFHVIGGNIPDNTTTPVTVGERAFFLLSHCRHLPSM